MNKFDPIVSRSRTRYLFVTVFGGTLLLIAALAAIVWLGFVKGYALEIGPNEISGTKRVSIDSGIGVVIADRLYTVSDIATLTVSAPLYFSEEISTERAVAGTLSVTLQPRPSLLSASSVPPVEDMRWLVNDELAAIDAALSIELEPGRHEITADSPLHRVETQTVEVKRAETATISFVLQPATVTFDLNSRPPGADVTLNDVAVGVTPLRVERPAGDYEIALALPSYLPVREQVRALKTQPVIERDYRLEALGGTVRVQVAPTGGVLLVDGRNEKPGRDIPVAADRPVRISYSKQGYSDATQTVRLSPGASRALTFSLEPLVGTVTFAAEPEADLAIDGRPVGRTPVTMDLSAVPLEATFSRQGYRTVTRRLTPDPDTPRRVSVSLLTEFEARRAAGEQTTAQRLGIEMLRFDPNRVTLGSPPGERGRFRNEFEREVLFSRPFFLSKTEITQAQYAAFAQAQGGVTPVAAASEPDLPVSNISWLDAARFANWLSVQDGLPPFYLIHDGRYAGIDPGSNGYRLPTEAEWEWAARRAGRPTETMFVWGDAEIVPANAANLADESARGSLSLVIGRYNDGHAGKAPVGSFRTERAGLQDLAGNVSEWVHDRYTNQPPPEGPLTDWMGASRGIGHVVKGASYRTARFSELRAAFRRQGQAADESIGFRLARYQ